MAKRPGTSRFNQRVTKTAGRLDDHKILLGVLVGLVGAFLGYIAFVSTTGPPFQSRYEIKVETPSDAPTLKRGDAVRIGGKLAGLISSVEPLRPEDSSTGEGGSLVTANITKTNFRPIGEDAGARVTVQSIVYRSYLELYPNNISDPMESGDTITMERVQQGVDLLEVVQLFDQEARESLRSTVVNLGFGVAGRGDETNDTLKALKPTSKNLEKQLGAATQEEGAIGRGLEGASNLTQGLEGRSDDDVAGLISSGSEVIGTIADRPTQLGETIRRLPGFEDQFLATAPLADPLLDQLATTAVELEPAVRGLNAALPGINRLLSLGDTLESETATITALTRPVLRTTKPVVSNIYPTVAALDPLVDDVDQIVDVVTPYADDIAATGQQLADATSVPFNFGQGLGVGAPAGRVIPVLTCHSNRNPFPGPGEALNDSEPC